MAAIKVIESSDRAMRARRLALTLPIWAIGMAGLLLDSWPGAPHLPNINLHAIFGAMLWLMVVVQFRHASFARPRLRGAALRDLCRRLSRQVYLLLYVLFGVSQLVRIAAMLWNDGTQGDALHPAILPPPEILRDYLAYGVVALLTIHVLAALSLQALKRIVAR